MGMEIKEVMYMMKRFITAFLALAMLAALMPGSLADQGNQKH